MQKGKLDLWNFTLRKNRLSKPNNNIKGILLLRIERQYARFKQKELFIRLKKGRSDQTRRARTQQNIETVCLFAVQSLKIFCQRYSQEMGLSRMDLTTVRILKLDWKLFPYHIQVKQKLTAQDEQARVEMYSWFND